MLPSPTLPPAFALPSYIIRLSASHYSVSTPMSMSDLTHPHLSLYLSLFHRLCYVLPIFSVIMQYDERLRRSYHGGWCNPRSHLVRRNTQALFFFSSLFLTFTRINDKPHQRTASAMLWSRTAYHLFSSRVGISVNARQARVTPEDINIIYHLSSSRSLCAVSTAWHMKYHTPRNQHISYPSSQRDICYGEIFLSPSGILA